MHVAEVRRNVLKVGTNLLECGKRGEDRSSNPDGVFALGRGDDLDLDRRTTEIHSEKRENLRNVDMA